MVLTFDIQYQALSSSKILLVPYKKRHVPTYHEWMKSEVNHIITFLNLNINIMVPFADKYSPTKTFYEINILLANVGNPGGYSL